MNKESLLIKNLKILSRDICKNHSSIESVLKQMRKINPYKCIELWEGLLSNNYNEILYSDGGYDIKYWIVDNLQYQLLEDDDFIHCIPYFVHNKNLLEMLYAHNKLYYYSNVDYVIAYLVRNEKYDAANTLLSYVFKNDDNDQLVGNLLQKAMSEIIYVDADHYGVGGTRDSDRIFNNSQADFYINWIKKIKDDESQSTAIVEFVNHIDDIDLYFLDEETDEGDYYIYRDNESILNKKDKTISLDDVEIYKDENSQLSIEFCGLEIDDLDNTILLKIWINYNGVEERHFWIKNVILDNKIIEDFKLLESIDANENNFFAEWIKIESFKGVKDISFCIEIDDEFDNELDNSQIVSCIIDFDGGNFNFVNAKEYNEDENMDDNHTTVPRIIEQDVKNASSILSKYINSTTKTIDLLDEFEGYDTNHPFEKLLIENRFSVYVEGELYFVQFIIERGTGDDYEGGITFTDFKKGYTDDLLKHVIEDLEMYNFDKYINKNTIYQFDTPYLLKAQNSRNRQGYGWEWDWSNGVGTYTEGTQYGETTKYFFVGCYIKTF